MGKSFFDLYYANTTPENRAKIDALKAEKEREKAEKEAAAAEYAKKAKEDYQAGKPQNSADRIIGMAEDAKEKAAAQAAENNAAQVVPDTYDATLREVARANTQLQMAATNGRAGSVLGIGTDNYTATNATRHNKRIGIDDFDKYRRRDSRMVNQNRMQRNSPTSIFNLPFASDRTLGGRGGMRF